MNGPIENRDEFTDLLKEKVDNYISPSLEVPSWDDFEEYARKKKALAGRDKPFIFLLMRYAAIGLILIGLCVGVYHFSPEKESVSLVEETKIKPTENDYPSNLAALRDTSSNNGSNEMTLMSTLNNSSEVLREAESTNLYAANQVNQEERGEMLFKVVQSGSEEPIVVVANDVDVDHEKIYPYFVNQIDLAPLFDRQIIVLQDVNELTRYSLEQYISEFEQLYGENDEPVSRWSTALFANASMKGDGTETASMVMIQPGSYLSSDNIKTLANSANTLYTSNFSDYDAANIVFNNSQKENNSWYISSPQLSPIDRNTLKHQPPLSLSMSISYVIKPKISLESGIVYSYLYSFNRHYSDLRSYSQKVHYIGVPVSIMYNFLPDRSDFGLYSIAGVMFEKAISAKGIIEIPSETNTIKEIVSVNTPKIMMSSNLGLGFGYDFLKSLGVYAEAYLGYYFYTKEQPLTFKTTGKVIVNTRLGLRYIF